MQEEKVNRNIILRKENQIGSWGNRELLCRLKLFKPYLCWYFSSATFFFKCGGISEQLAESLDQWVVHWVQRFTSLSDHGPIIIYLVSNWLWFGQNRWSLGLQYLKNPCHLYHILDEDVLKVYLYGFDIDGRICAINSFGEPLTWRDNSKLSLFYESDNSTQGRNARHNMVLECNQGGPGRVRKCNRKRMWDYSYF